MKSSNKWLLLVGVVFITTVVATAAAFPGAKKPQYDPIQAALADIAKMEVGKLDWPQWGGPHGDFKADSSGLANNWPDGGPKKLWSRDLGDGDGGAAPP